MGTYARYVLWAGVLLAEDSATADHPFISQVLDQIDPVERDGLQFIAVSMHGETIGVGVQISELDWVPISEVGAGRLDEFDPRIGRRALEVLRHVRDIFRPLGIQEIVKLYHHLDLGD